MRNRSEQHKSSGDFPAETESTVLPLPPISSSAASAQLGSSSPAKHGKSSKFSCALNALKCSSRAADEENSLAQFPILSKKGYDRIGDFDGKSTMRSISPGSPQTPTQKGQERRYSEGYDSDASVRLLEVSGMETIEHAPFEDLEEEGDGHRHDLHPSRTASDETPETPNTSNRDPRKMAVPTILTGRSVPDANFDEFCQSNFNTPRMLHSKGSLGDTITPLVSPDNAVDDGDEDHDALDRDPRPSLDPLTRHALQLPRMHSNRDPFLRDSFLSLGSSTSFLVGEMISDERKVSEGRSHMIVPERSENHAEADVDAPQKINPPVHISIEERETPGHESYQSLVHPEESSCSSVSSFVEALKQNKTRLDQSRRSPIPPFFWRTHPTTIVHSYEFQHFPVSSRHVFTNSNDDDDDLISVDIGLPVGVARTWIKDKTASFDPAGIRETWITSQAFGWQVAKKTTSAITDTPSHQHPQGPPSKRSAAYMQSFTSLAASKFAAVFTSSDSTRLRISSKVQE